MLNFRAVGLKWWVSGYSLPWWFFSYFCRRFAAGLDCWDWPIGQCFVFCHLLHITCTMQSDTHEVKVQGQNTLDVQHPHATGSPCCSSLVAGRIRSYAWRTATWRHGWSLLFVYLVLMGAAVKLIFLANAAAVWVVTCIQLSMPVGSLLWDICFRSIGTRRRIYYYCVAILFGPVACGWLVPVSKCFKDEMAASSSSHTSSSVSIKSVKQIAHNIVSGVSQNAYFGYGFLWNHTVSTRILITLAFSHSEQSFCWRIPGFMTPQRCYCSKGRVGMGFVEIPCLVSTL